jgi:hypothetical protein
MRKLLLTVVVVLFACAYTYGQQVQSGSFFYSSAESKSYTLHANEGKRLVEYEITFVKPFESKPKVIVSTTLLDAVKSTQIRYSIRATGISRDGFVLLAEVWGDTQLSAIGGNWLAHTEQ